MPNRITHHGNLSCIPRKVLDLLNWNQKGKRFISNSVQRIALGYRVKEMPAILKGRKKGRSKFKFKKTALSTSVFSFSKADDDIWFSGPSDAGVGGSLVCTVVYLRYVGVLTPGRPCHLCAPIDPWGIQILSLRIHCNSRSFPSAGRPPNSKRIWN